MRRTRLRALAATSVLVLVGAGCSDDGGGGESLDVEAVDYAFEGLPDEIDAGRVEITLENTGEVDHEIAFVEIGDTEPEQFFEDFGPVIEEGAPFPDYIGSVIGANEAPPGESGTFTYTLPGGTYMAFCALTGDAEDPESEEGGAPHFTQGMQQVVTVSGDDSGDLPAADGTITARDYEFDIDLAEGDSTINFTNEGPNDHFAGFDLVPGATTADEAVAAFQALELGEGDAPEGVTDLEEIGFSGIASEGRAIQFEVDALEPGAYVFYCFIADRAGGPPHAIGNGMVTGFVVE